MSDQNDSQSLTRSLMESAAKSLLDTPSAPQLHSLQREKLPAMPYEQDRKSFLGCLAAVLASGYEYDTVHHDDDAENDHRSLEDEVFASFYEDDDEEDAQASKHVHFDEGGSGSNMDRTRRRRYQVLSRLLVDSADYLCVEKGQAKAFIPMLSQLLKGRTPARHFTQKGGVLDRITGAPVHDFGRGDVLTKEIEHIPYLKMFLESLMPGAGFRCTALLLLQYLMNSQEGYDARVRRVIKTVGVLTIACDMRHDPELYFPTRKRKSDWVALATRKFENLEHAIAYQLIVLSKKQQTSGGKPLPRKAKLRDELQPYQQGITREQLMRGIKIGGTAVIAGTLFAVTGGLAAPSIAAGVAAFAGGTAAAAFGTGAVTTIFGVGGGSLAAYKMNRRTAGLTDFRFQKESSTKRKTRRGESTLDIEAELFSTICISGWLRDKFDFQRPWGVTPSKPRLSDRVELLERFYSIHRPDQIPKVHRILSNWKGEEKDLWALLAQKYGSDPDHLFPLDRGPRLDCALTLDDQEVLDGLFVALGYTEMENTKHKSSPLDRLKTGWREQSNKKVSPPSATTKTTFDSSSVASSVHGDSIALSMSFSSQHQESRTSRPEAEYKPPKHLSTVWDYSARYGGELYTVQWETDLLLELCGSVSDLAFDLVGGGTTRILLSHTVFSTLLSAFAWPLALINAANLIDGTWTLAVERADQAGIELAQSLLFSEAGKRPVTLIGYSFGARAIYSCLKELSRHQAKWEAVNLQTPADDDGFMDDELYKSSSDLESERIDESYYRKMREPASVVEDAVLMGLPNHLSISSWLTCRSVVAGRLVNCFSQRDMILSLMFQVKRFGIKPVCGTCPVAVPGVENIDVSDLVKGHQDYCLIMGKILRRIRHCQPFRSRPSRGFVPDLSVGDGKRIEKYDV